MNLNNVAQNALPLDGFTIHKGYYGTRMHREALVRSQQRHEPRQSFGVVSNLGS